MLYKIDYGTCTFKRVCFLNTVSWATCFKTNHFHIVKGAPPSLPKEVESPSPHQHIKNLINLKGIIPKARPTYTMTTAKEHALRT